MTISKYEAAALYDNNDKHLESNYVVLDLDDCSYGLCRCSEHGETTLLKSWNSINVNIWAKCVERIQKMIGDYSLDISNELEKQLLSGNRILYNYIISDRRMDDVLFRFSEHVISCSEFEKCLSGVMPYLNDLLSKIGNQVAPDVLESTDVIILGRAQEIFLVLYEIKKSLSAEPLLPDERFRNTEFRDPYNEIVSIGQALYESKSLIQHDYSLMIFNKENDSVEKFVIVKKGQKRESLLDVVYFGPVMLLKNDRLTLFVDNREVSIETPYSFETLESDLVELGIGIQDNEIALFFRRCRFPDYICCCSLSRYDY